MFLVFQDQHISAPIAGFQGNVCIVPNPPSKLQLETGTYTILLKLGASYIYGAIKLLGHSTPKLFIQYLDSLIDKDPRLRSQVEYSMFQEGVLKPCHLKFPQLIR